MYRTTGAMEDAMLLVAVGFSVGIPVGFVLGAAGVWIGIMQQVDKSPIPSMESDEAFQARINAKDPARFWRHGPAAP